MSEEEMKVAIVGCGMIGRVHADAISLGEGMTVVAVVDLEVELAEQLADDIARTAGKRPVVASTIEEALAATPVDLVTVATPSGLHVDVAVAVLDANKHLLLEKPLDVDVARGKRLLRAAEEAAARGVVSSVMSQHRFDPEVEVLAEAISKDRFGRVTSAVASVAWWRSQSYYDSGAWRGTWALDGGGALMNQGVHTVDLLLWFLGKPVEIVAYWGVLAHERIEVEDTVVAVIRFESGALATLHATTAAYPGVANRIQVHGDHGSGIIDVNELSYYHSAGASGRVPSPMGIGFGDGNDADEALPADRRTHRGEGLAPGHLRQYRDIQRALATGSRPRVTVEDALDALTAVRAVYLSAALREPIAFADVLSGRYDDVQMPQVGELS